MIVVDTGVLFALADRGDTYHRACVHWLAGTRGELVVPPLVIAEACYLVGRGLGYQAEAALLAAIGPGQRFTLADLTAEDLRRMEELVRRYGDLPLGATDASVVALAERLGTPEVATVDRRHFTVVRPRHVEAFQLYP